MKRSNIITIALSSLPPPRLLPPAIYSMDRGVLDREDVQVQYTLCPPEYEHFISHVVCLLDRHLTESLCSVDIMFFLKQRLQALIPTEEELCLIKEAKTQNPHAPLAQAELCLLTLGEIPHLQSRLQLWSFALDYDSLEQVL